MGAGSFCFHCPACWEQELNVHVQVVCRFPPPHRGGLQNLSSPPSALPPSGPSAPSECLPLITPWQNQTP